eukprot:SAG22_NODE_131_length_18561_cov_10.941387_7_plen_236_part_00
MDDAVKTTAAAILGLTDPYTPEMVEAAFVQSIADCRRESEFSNIPVLQNAAALLGLQSLADGTPVIDTPPEASDVTEGVWIGSRLASTADELAKIGAVSLVSVSAQHPPELEVLMADVPCLHVPWPDDLGTGETVVRDLGAVVAFVRSAAKPVLIYCQTGNSRAAAAVSAYLMAERLLTFDRAFSMVCARRPGCKLTDTLSARLLEYQSTLPAIAEPPKARPKPTEASKRKDKAD